MPKPGLRWRHVTINTHCSWHHGDPRGFRSHDGRLKSSGDYKHPPPKGEHAGLYRYRKSVGRPAVIIPPAARKPACLAIVTELQKRNYHVLAASVGGQHAHALVELPDDPAMIYTILGYCKRIASHAIRHMLPGQVWGAKGDIEPVDDREHHANTFKYILDHVDEGAYVWSYRDPSAKHIAHE